MCNGKLIYECNRYTMIRPTANAVTITLDIAAPHHVPWKDTCTAKICHVLVYQIQYITPRDTQ